MTSFYPNRSQRNNCAFCHEAGHHVRACSVLASNKCGYCHNLGHTTRRCPVHTDRDQNRHRQASSEKAKSFIPDANGFVRPKSTFYRRVTNQPAAMSTVRLVSTFSVLDDEADTEPKRTVQVAVPTPAKQRAIQGSWKKPLNADCERGPPIVNTLEKEVADCRSEIASMKATAAAAINQPPFVQLRYIGSWADAADLEDSDSDDDSIFLC